MSRTGRNDPCPCGSGNKYKRCCLDIDRIGEAELDRRLAGLEKDLAIKKVFGERQPIAPNVQAVIREIIAERKLNAVDPERLIGYIEPMVALCGTDRKSLETAVLTGNYFWRLSQVRNPSQWEEGVQFFSKNTGLSALGDTANVRLAADMMRKRHVALFPELHKKKSVMR